MSPHRGISLGANIALQTCALIIDGLQVVVSLLSLLPFVGFVLSYVLGVTLNILAFLLFGFWFSVLGVCIFRSYPLHFIVAIILENVPLFNFVPGWWGFVSYIIDRENAKASGSSGTL